MFKVEFEEFMEESDWLDNFFFQEVNIKNYENLSFVVKLVLTLSHGQASVEIIHANYEYWKIYLEEEIKKKAEIETEINNTIIPNDMEKLKDQCDAIKRTITMMEQDVSEFMLLDESKKDLAYVMKSNALKAKCDESKKILNFWKNSIQL